MVSLTWFLSASSYHPRYQIRSPMYIRGLIPRNFAEFAKAVPIGVTGMVPYAREMWAITTDSLKRHQSKQKGIENTR